MYCSGLASNLTMMKMSLYRSGAHCFLLLILPLFPLLSQEERPQYNSEALSHFLDGDLAMMEGDYKVAAAAFQRVLLYDSTSATVYLSLAEAFMGDGRFNEARQAGEKALRLESQDPRIHKFLAKNALARKDLDRAIVHLNEWVRLDPDNLEPLFAQADIFEKRDNFAKAIDIYIAIYDRNPVQEHVLGRAGELGRAIKDYERAYQAFSRWYKRRSDDPRVARVYAEVCIRTERYQEAARAFEGLLEAGDTSPQNRLQLSRLYWQVGDKEKAQALLRSLMDEGLRQWDVLSITWHVSSEMADYPMMARVAAYMVEVYPDSVAGHLGLARAKVLDDDRPAALVVLENALRKFPADADVNYMLANLYYGEKRYEAAEQRVLVAREQRPEARYIQHLLASVWDNLAKFGLSDSLFERLIESEPEDAVALNNYAYSVSERANVTKKQLKAAHKFSRRSLKLRKDTASFLDTYGWIYYRQGAYRRARKYILKSLEIDGDNLVVWEHLGEVYLKMGKGKEAREAFSKAEDLRRKEQPAVVRATDE